MHFLKLRFRILVAIAQIEEQELLIVSAVIIVSRDCFRCLWLQMMIANHGLGDISVG